MHYLKDLFNNKENKHTHLKFIRYSKGNFTGPIINLKITANFVKLNSSFHIVDELLEIFSKIIKNQKVSIKGSLSWNHNLDEELAKNGIKYLKVIKSRGIFNYKLDNFQTLLILLNLIIC